MERIQIKKIINTAKIEFKKWILDPRMLVLAVLMIFIHSMVISPLIENAEIMGEKINILEPFIAVMNSGVVILILPLCFMALIADFPKIDTNTVFIISRMGRKNWVLAQLLKLFFMAISFLLVVFIVSTGLVVLKGNVSGEWSKVITDFSEKFPKYSSNAGARLIPLNLYYQFPVAQAAVLSFLFVFLYLFIIGLILLFFSIYRMKTAGFVACGLVVCLGAATFAIGSDFQWLFPMANALIWIHKSTVIREGIYPMAASVAYLTIVPVILTIFCCIGVRNFNYDNITEVVY